MSWLFTAALLLSALVAPQLAKADVVFSNLTSAGASTDFEAISDSPVFFGASFLSSATYTLTDAEVLVVALSGQEDFNLYLYSDSSGLPGTDLGEIGSGAASSTTGYVTVDASGSLTLTSGDTYWLVMGPANSDTNVLWYEGGSTKVPTATGTPGSFSGIGDTTLQFEIDGTPVPEPSSLWLIGGVTMLLCLVKRRKEQPTR